MARTVDTNFTKRKLEKWLLGLTKPRKQLDGLPVCPYLKHYRDRIHLARNKDPERLARHFAEVKDIFKFEACVVFGFWMSWNKMEKMVDTLNKDLKKKDVCCFMMHPDGDEDVLPVEYPFDIPVLIVQKISTLEKAKKQLSKTNYYKHYK